MKKWKISLIVLSLFIASVIILGIWLSAPVEAKSYTTQTNSYYKWGIKSETSLPITDGSIPTEVTITFKGLTNVSDNSTDVLYVNLIDEPPIGFTTYTDTGTGNFFATDGIRLGGNGGTTDPNILAANSSLVLEYYDRTPGKEDVVIRLSQINNPLSWTWKVFKSPFDFRLSNDSIVHFSSALLTFIDCAGAGEVGFGLGMDPDGQNNFIFDNLTIDVKVESYGTTVYTQKTIHISLNKPPYIFKF